jgi:hypothetical protein
MPLLKDIQTTLNKISMQAEKSNLQFEKTFNSMKTSIKKIKDVNSNIKDLKINNDEYNKTLQKSQTNSTKLLKQVDNYLENPTQEEALKVKNQINVSNNYLTKAKNVFSNNKISSDKLINSYNEYKNDGLITNFDKLNQLYSRLTPSFTKLINYFGKLKAKSKTKAQTQAQARKVYSAKSPTPHPNCQRYYEKLAREKRNRTKTEEEIASDELSVANKNIKIKSLDDEYKIIKKYYSDILNGQTKQLGLGDRLFSDYEYKFKQVQDDNINGINNLKKLNLDLYEATISKDNKKINYIKDNIATFTGIYNENFDKLIEAGEALGPHTKESIAEIREASRLTGEVFSELEGKLNRVIYKIQIEVENLTNKIEDTKKLLILINVIIDRFEKWIKKNCPS